MNIIDPIIVEEKKKEERISTLSSIKITGHLYSKIQRNSSRTNIIKTNTW